MRGPFLLSVSAHALLVAVLYFGLPKWLRPDAIAPVTVEVELVVETAAAAVIADVPATPAIEAVPPPVALAPPPQVEAPPPEPEPPAPEPVPAPPPPPALLAAGDPLPDAIVVLELPKPPPPEPVVEPPPEVVAEPPPLAEAELLAEPIIDVTPPPPPPEPVVEAPPPSPLPRTRPEAPRPEAVPVVVEAPPVPTPEPTPVPTPVAEPPRAPTPPAAVVEAPAPPAAPTLAQAGQAGTVTADAMAQYAFAINRKVDAVKQYPAQALRRREQGTIEVRVSLNARGEIVAIEAAQAEPRLLVQAALDAVRMAAPYPSLDAIGRSDAQFLIPVRFEVR